METKTVLLIVFGVLFVISSVVAVAFYLEWNQYVDYGGVKVRLPIDSTTEAIAVASSSDDFREFVNSGIDYYYVAPKLTGPDGDYSVTFTGRYNYNTNEKIYSFTVFKSGKTKTMSDFRAEREATR